MKTPKCTGQRDDGFACLAPATQRVIIAETKIGFRCPDHKVKASKGIRTVALSDAERTKS